MPQAFDADFAIGTWIPIERGLALAKQYGVEDLLRPIIDYVPTSVSPPPAPKHVVAAPTKTKKEKEKKDATATPSKTGPSSAAALQAQAQLASQRNASAQKAAAARRVDSTPDAGTSPRSGDDSLLPSPGDDSSSSRTPSPVAEIPLTLDNQMEGRMDIDGMGGVGMMEPGSSSRKRNVAAMMEEDTNAYDHLQRARGQSAVHTPTTSPRPLNGSMNDPQLGPEQYTDIILTYFVSETTQIPQILVSPPPDYNPDTPIDEDGHTALHWACAMGRVRVVKLLLTAGAAIYFGNHSEQTPLMRSVMFSNNYDIRKFPELYELLHRSTLNIDKHNRTVFHHIANLALNKGKTHAARYYMETILSRLADYPQELADVINFQDEDGETALTLAARARSRRLVKALLDHGADPKIKNRDFKSAEDYILEDERFRSSPVPGAQSTSKTVLGDKPFAPQLYNSDAARMTAGSCLADITAHMQSLAKSFDAELQGKERDTLQAKALLTHIHTEVTEAQKVIHALTVQAGPVEEYKRELEQLQTKFKAQLSDNMRKGWETWSAGQKGREERWRNGQAGAEDVSDLPELSRLPEGEELKQAEEERLRWEVGQKRQKRAELLEQLVQAQAEVSHGLQDSVIEPKLTNA